jgi:hypothetical protein
LIITKVHIAGRTLPSSLMASWKDLIARKSYIPLQLTMHQPTIPWLGSCQSWSQDWTQEIIFLDVLHMLSVTLCVTNLSYLLRNVVTGSVDWVLSVVSYR